MQEGKYLMAVRRLTTEPPIITWGLPELTKYFLLAYRGAYGSGDSECMK